MTRHNWNGTLSFIIQNFSAMTDEQLDSFEDMSELELDLTMLNAGVPVSGENFLKTILTLAGSGR